MITKIKAWDSHYFKLVDVNSISFKNETCYVEFEDDIDGLVRYTQVLDMIKLLQYTGLNDSNNQEIYEDYVVRIKGNIQISNSTIKVDGIFVVEINLHGVFFKHIDNQPDIIHYSLIFSNNIPHNGILVETIGTIYEYKSDVDEKLLKYDVKLIRYGGDLALIYNDNKDTIMAILSDNGGFYIPEIQQWYKSLDTAKKGYIKYLCKKLNMKC